MPKPEDRTSDPCAADLVLIGSGGRLPIRVQFVDSTPELFLVSVARDGSETLTDVTALTIRYEFDADATLLVEFEPPPDVRIGVGQRTGDRGDFGPLAAIPLPSNDRCVPVQFQVWDASGPTPEPNSPAELEIKPRKHSPKIGTSKTKPVKSRG
jgi:hypothetical protein